MCYPSYQEKNILKILWRIIKEILQRFCCLSKQMYFNLTFNNFSLSSFIYSSLRIDSGKWEKQP
jgi:hypothetical protein